jgi:putative spermidine/putrescine transport system ATP-binding protein
VAQLPASVELVNLCKRYGSTAVVQGVSLKIEPGSFVSLLGPSGCGKTTTLRMIAGFITPTSGTVLVRGQSVEGLPPHKRDMGMVFQNYALFPHLTVARNVAFGLEMRGRSRDEIQKAVREALAMVRLPGVEDRLPKQLSGGQQQRVALARALVINPSVLLLDEPLSNLDAKLRLEMRAEIRALQQRIGITTIFVTHDQEEALALSHKIVVLNGGKIEQVGTPQEVYETPATPFIARFMGNTNLLDVTVAAIVGGNAIVRTAEGLTLRAAVGPHVQPGQPAHLALRPETLRLCSPDESGALRGRILGATYQGHSSLYEVELGSFTTLRVLAPRHDLAIGENVGIRVEPVHAKLIATRKEVSA